VRIGQALNNLGSSYNRVGRTTDGLVLIEEALPILIARLGDRHPSVASAYNNRGAALAALGRYDEALADYARARERIEPLATPGDRRLLTVLLNEAESLARMGRSADALERIERIEAAESGVPAALLDGASVAAAEALLRQGDGAGAANRARSVLDRTPDQPSGRRALAWVVLAEALQQQGDAAAARSALGDVDAEIERLGAEVDANALRAIREQTRLLLALELPGDAARTLSAHHARLSGLLGADDPRVRALADDMRAMGAAPP
jgi:tetratricopeptide (TPR) repeat protein